MSEAKTVFGTNLETTSEKYSESERLLSEARQYLAAGVSSNARLVGKRPKSSSDCRWRRSVRFPAREQQAVGGQVFGGQTPLKAQLAAKVVELVPCAELVRFTNTGTEADLLAVRLARAFTGRPKIIKFEGHYHGWGDGLAVSIKPPFVQADGRTTVQTHPESLEMTPSSYDDVIVLPWNDLDATEACLNWQGQTVAGVIMKPVMCNSGVITPRPGYLEKVRELCTACGTLLIFDEVITGFRLAPGGAQEKFGVIPALKALDSMGVQLIELLEESLKRHEIAGQVQGYGAHFGLFFAPSERRIQNFQDLRLVDRGAGDEFVARMLDAGVRIASRASFFLSTAHTSSDIEDAAEAADAILAEMAQHQYAAAQ